MPDKCLLRDWTDSRKVNALDAFAERFFLRLFMKCDDYGRFHGDPLLLKSALFPLLPSVRETDISRWSAACAHAGLLRSYVAANGRTYLEVLNFGQQKKWMKSEHPPPVGQIGLPLPEKPSGGCRSRSRSRSRGEETNGHSNPFEPVVSHTAFPPVPAIKNGTTAKPVRRETWQLLKDEQNLTARIRQEAASTNPDAALILALKSSRAQVRAELKQHASHTSPVSLVSLPTPHP